MQTTFAMVKSDAIKRGSLSAILYNIRDKGFVVVGEKFRWLTVAEVEFLYRDHLGKPYFPNLWDSVRRGAYLMAVEHNARASDVTYDAVGLWRLAMCGEYQGTLLKGPNLRSVYGRSVENPADNALHGSDSVESAKRELGFFFPELNRM